MINTPKLPFWVDSEGLGYPQIVNEDGWVASAAENRIDFIVLACNFHERLRDQLQAVVRSATEQELDNATRLLAELVEAEKK